MNAEEYLKRGIDYFNKEDHNQAIVELTEALRLDPNLAEAKKYLTVSIFNRGVASFQKGDIDRAIDDFTKATEYDKTDVQYLGALASALRQKKDYDRSIEVWTAFIDLDKTALGYHARANDYYGKSKKHRLAGDKDNFLKYLDLAIKDFENCLNHNPDDERRAVAQNQLELARGEKKNREEVYEAIDKIPGLFQ